VTTVLSVRKSTADPSPRVKGDPHREVTPLQTLSVRLAVVVLLLAAFAQTAYTVRGTSMTVDEGLHITSGYTILRTGDFRLVEEHPPLIKYWLALPLLPVRDLPDVTQIPAWQETPNQPLTESLPLLQVTQRWFYPYLPIERLVLPARMMAALLGVLLLAIVARWASDLWGTDSVPWVLALAAFDPNIIAHSAVASTDIGSAAMILLSLLTMVRLFKRLRIRHALLAGTMMGMALTTKLTSVLLAPAFLFIGLKALVQLSEAGDQARRQRLRVVALGLLTLVTGGITFWAIYGFRIGAVPGLPLPLPAPAHAIPILRLLSHSGAGHQGYLLGLHANHGWWYYFPVAWVLKTPLPALIAGLAALLLLASSSLRPTSKDLLGQRQRAPYAWPLGVFVLVYGLASVSSSLNIGYRHLLPIVPGLYLLIGALVGLRSWKWPALLLGSSLLLWQALGTLSVLPYPLGFHNEITGGSNEGWRYLADSNTDWGQGYKALARFQDAEGIPRLELSAFVFYDPALYGVTYAALPPLRGDTPPVFPSRFAPPAGHYAISMTPLDGVPTSDPEMYDWFRWREPDATIAHAIRYYHVSAEETATAWLAQCTQPQAPLDARAIKEGFGLQDPRVLAFDCLQSWIYPHNAASPGVYAIHGAQLGDTLRARLHYVPPPVTDEFLRLQLETTQISYRQRAYRDVPAFALYRATAGAALPQCVAWAARAESPDAHVEPASVPDIGLSASFDLAGPLRFLGAESISATGGLEVRTWWEVTQASDGRPLSLMAHLLLPDGSLAGIADGLGVPPVEWELGDILVQRHRFPDLRPLDKDSGGYILRTGAYWLDTGERWEVAAGSEGGENVADAIFVRMPQR
jgi:hypothetical protein